MIVYISRQIIVIIILFQTIKIKQQKTTSFTEVVLQLML